MYEGFEKDVRRYHKLKQAKKKAEKEMDEIKSRILDNVPATFNMDVGEFNVSVSTFTMNKPDHDAIKSYLGEKYQNFTKEVTSTRLTIKELTDNKK